MMFVDVHKLCFAILAAVIGALVSPPASAQAVDTHLNQPWVLGDIFDNPPPRATARAGSSCKTAEAYVAHIDAGRWREIGELFAEDAVYLPPNLPKSQTLKGRKAIAEWFSQIHGVKRAIPVSFIDAGAECFMEIVGVLDHNGDDKFHLQAIDHFTMNVDGKIVRAVYYFRPDTIRVTDANINAVKASSTSAQ